MRIELKTEEIIAEKSIENASVKEQNEISNADYQDEKEKMTILQRIGWIWDYYKWYIIIPIGVLLAGIYTYFCLIQEIGPTYLRTTMINAAMSDESDVKFDDLFMEEKKPDESEGEFLVDTGLVHPEIINEANSGDTVIVASVQKYNALLTNGDTDITISSKWVIEQFIRSGSYYDLSEILPKDLYDNLQDRIYYSEEIIDGKTIPVGVKLDGIKCVDKFYENGDIPVLTLSSRTKRLDHAIEFIEWIVNQ